MADLSFCALKSREVVNICDGKKLGHILDITFTKAGTINGIIVPGDRRFLKSITSGESIFVPWSSIVKFGEDAILIQLGEDNTTIVP